MCEFKRKTLRETKGADVEVTEKRRERVVGGGVERVPARSPISRNSYQEMEMTDKGRHGAATSRR